VKLPALVAVVLLAGPVAAAADTLEDKYQSLKDAVTSKNVLEIKKLATELFPLVTEALAAPAPQGEDDKEAWSSGIAHAKGIGQYAEYALFSTAIESPAPVLVDLISTLEEENPKSQYLDTAYGSYLVALSQTGAGSKVPAIAEKALVHFPENGDLLLVLADNAVNRKQTDRALNYANRLTAAMVKHRKPEGTTAAQWEHKRNASLGRGYWIAGMIYGERSQYAAADKNLRAALPLIPGNQAMVGPALFYLGMANYQLGKMTLNKARVQEAAKFSEQSAAIESAFADQARHNAIVMKTEADRMR
jgi:tetratricopeptide (TPR) repeat protein